MPPGEALPSQGEVRRRDSNVGKEESNVIEIWIVIVLSDSVIRFKRVKSSHPSESLNGRRTMNDSRYQNLLSSVSPSAPPKAKDHLHYIAIKAARGIITSPTIQWKGFAEI